MKVIVVETDRSLADPGPGGGLVRSRPGVCAPPAGRADDVIGRAEHVSGAPGRADAGAEVTWC